jgi:hypothetical protein
MRKGFAGRAGTFRHRLDMNDSVLLKLMEEFVCEIRNGKAPDPEAYAALYPQFAERIREIFPTLLLLENAASANPDPRIEKQRLHRKQFSVLTKSLER